MSTINNKFLVKNGLAVGGASGIDVINSSGVWIGATGNLSGATGQIGSQGVGGATGPQGVQGIQGIQGIQGAQGTQGAQGASGSTGLTGATGIDGATGIQGASGSTGIIGASGVNGSTGVQGATGIQGIQGASGATGFQGASGATGIGATGFTGATGTQGPAGQSSSYYDYVAKTGQQSGDPGSGHINWNNATLLSSTQLQISHLTSAGVDVDIFLAIVNLNDIFVIQEADDSTRFQKWQVNGTPTIISESYVEFPVILLDSGGTTIANNDEIILAIVSTPVDGATGVQGASGVGATGPQGVQGASGSTGIQGASGSTGLTGATGVQGIQGASGSIGLTGATGIQGTTGAQGIQGASGATGTQGIQGIQGASGATGPQGVQGIQGVVGASGATGSKGDQGVQGASGATGSQGIQGASGATGSQGGQGIQGASGATGVAGTNGTNGATGTAGATGVANAGATGVQGASGATGVAGTNGATGIQGIQGATGPDGATGLLQNWVVKTTTYTAVNKDMIVANTSSAAFTITLPSSPSTGWSVSFADPEGTWATNNLTVARNGSTIEDAAQDLILDVSNVSVDLVYDGSTWQAFTNIGPIGATGEKGDEGADGASGATGTQGVQGTTGPQGIQGASGAAGSQGNQGASGATGTQGVQGTTGVQGVQGATGISGATGTQGVQGTTGPQGIQGASGATGVQGTTGPQGIQGASGATGTAGGQGIQGVQGASGAIGSQGVQGASGATGIGGATGVRGASGATGSQGGQGIQGASGVGATGATGAAGPVGASGTSGGFGASGIAGSAGATGAAGASGISNNGATGVQGASGATGVAGTNGATGTAGSNGATGLTGATGVAGTNGATGSVNLFTAQFGPQTGATGATGSVQIRGGLQVGTGATGATGSITASGTISSSRSIGASGVQGAFAYGTLNYPDGNIMGSWSSSVDSYNQLLLQNTSTGTAASSNFVVSNDQATNSTWYGELGMNSSLFGTGVGGASGASGAFFQPNMVYVAAQSTDLTLGTLGAKPIHFVVNSGAQDAMTINSNGRVSVNPGGATGATGAKFAIGTTSAKDLSLIGGVFSSPQLAIESADTYTALSMIGYSSTGGPMIALGRSKSGALGTLTTTTASDFLGGITFDGVSTNNDFRNGANIFAFQDGDSNPTRVPTRLAFQTGATGSPAERLRINSHGGVNVANYLAVGTLTGATGATGAINAVNNISTGTITVGTGATGATGTITASGRISATSGSITTGATGYVGATGSIGSPAGYFNNLFVNGVAVSGGGGSATFSRKTTTYTAVSGDNIIADTTSAGFTITLPATPSSGSNVRIVDGGNFNVNNLTVARNGSTIEGGVLDFILDVRGVEVLFVYDGTTWQVYASVGAQGASGIIGASGTIGVNGATGPVGASGAGASITITDDNTTNANYYPMMSAVTSGIATAVYTASTEMYFNPSSGTLSATQFNSLSDEKFKDNFTPITNALELINSLKPGSFTWKSNGKKAYGVLAQETELILPEIVDSYDGKKTVSYDQMIPILIQAVKDLQKEIIELKERNDNT